MFYVLTVVRLYDDTDFDKHYPTVASQHEHLLWSRWGWAISGASLATSLCTWHCILSALCTHL